MRPVVTTALSVAVLLLVLSLTASPVAAQSDVDQEPEQAIVFSLQPQGHARISVVYAFNVSSPAHRERFKETAAVFEQKGFAPGSSRERPASAQTLFENVVALKNAETSREMAIRDQNYTSRIDDDVGYLNYSFTWTNFTRMPDPGEPANLTRAFVVENRSWLLRTYDNQELRIVRPANYKFHSIGPGPRKNGSRLVYGPNSRVTGTLKLSQDGSRGPMSWFDPRIAQVGGLVVVGAVVILLLTQREQVISRLPVDPTLIIPAGTTTSPTTDSDTDDDTDEQHIPTEPLSDEEQVIHLLHSNGGRMRQAKIVDATGWSDAKVSQLLSGMDEDDQIEKLRIGRENLISLPGHTHDVDSGTTVDHGNHGHNRS